MPVAGLRWPDVTEDWPAVVVMPCPAGVSAEGLGRHWSWRCASGIIPDPACIESIGPPVCTDVDFDRVKVIYNEKVRTQFL
ncbi:MAG: hypothetical protein OXH93_19450 [Caldilineaceae bacterium]|nr:hypothetical protein [Caldilineaceae bacterium]